MAVLPDSLVRPDVDSTSVRRVLLRNRLTRREIEGLGMGRLLYRTTAAGGKYHGSSGASRLPLRPSKWVEEDEISRWGGAEDCPNR